MKTFTIDGKEYRYPISWAEVPYQQFTQLHAIQQDTASSPTRKAGSVLALLAGVERSIIDAAEPRLVLAVLDAMPFIGQTPPDAVVTEFDASGETYYVRDLDAATFGQFAAYEDIAFRNRKQPLLGLPQQLVMLCRKAGEGPGDLPEAEVRRRVALFEALPTTTVLNVAASFRAAARSIQAATDTSSAVELVRAALLRELDAITTSSGGGSVPRLPWLRRYYARLLRWCLT